MLETETSVFSSETVESFPSRFGYDISFQHTNSKRSIGFFYSYQSTGGRVHYSDYSGELKMDQIINGNSIGGFITKDFNHSEKFKVYGGTRLGLTVSKLKIKNTIALVDQQQQYLSERYEFESLNLFVSPLLGGKMSFHNFYCFLEIGYEWHVTKNPLTLEGADDAYLQGKGGEEIHADWDGFRMTLGLAYSF